MDPHKEAEFKSDITRLCESYGLTDGHLVLYLEDGAIKFTGNLKVSALGPLLVTSIMEKLKK